jgi:hypothetical protein
MAVITEGAEHTKTPERISVPPYASFVYFVVETRVAGKKLQKLFTVDGVKNDLR